MAVLVILNCMLNYWGGGELTVKLHAHWPTTWHNAKIQHDQKRVTEGRR